MKKELRYVVDWFVEAGVSDISSDQKIQKKEITSLEELKKIIRGVPISLKDSANNMVFGVGNPKSDLLLLGEAPGSEEDKQGMPFVGQSGQLLDKILASIGLDREKVYITNILPWRPPGNRSPTGSEITLFRPYVLKHIELVAPKLVVCLGGTATKALLETSKGIMQLRGIFTKISELNAEILPTFHPAFLLRSPSQKREVWADFLKIKHFLNKIENAK